MLLAFPISWYAMDRWLMDFAYKLPVAWWIYAEAGFLTVAIALVTVSYQTIKAARMNPVKSLRAE